MLPPQPRPLLTGSQEDGPRLPRLQECMQLVRERDDAASWLRSQELAFLANVLLSGARVQERPLTTKEAFDCAAATCNLGLENWPPHWLAGPRPGPGTAAATAPLPEDSLVSHDLATVFQVGWAVLHENVSMFAAERLLDTRVDLRCSDRGTQLALAILRRELTKHWRAGSRGVLAAPWTSS